MSHLKATLIYDTKKEAILSKPFHSLQNKLNLWALEYIAFNNSKQEPTCRKKAAFTMRQDSVAVHRLLKSWMGKACVRKPITSSSIHGSMVLMK